MSEYTTGEIAKLCGVSVRTVQYYDTRGILVPSELSEGGRRLYSEKDLDKMKIICFLRDLELPIDSIKELFSEDCFEEILSILLDQQQKSLRREIAEKQARADKIADVKRALSRLPDVSAESFGDIAYMMENKKRLRRLRLKLILAGAVMDVIQVLTLVLWIVKGVRWPFAVGMAVVVLIGVWVSAAYFKGTAYICSQCHTVFKPTFRESLFAAHTPHTRKLTCTHCKHHGFCVETVEKERRYAEN